MVTHLRPASCRPGYCTLAPMSTGHCRLDPQVAASALLPALAIPSPHFFESQLATTTVLTSPLSRVPDFRAQTVQLAPILAWSPSLPRTSHPLSWGSGRSLGGGHECCAPAKKHKEDVAGSRWAAPSDPSPRRGNSPAEGTTLPREPPSPRVRFTVGYLVPLSLKAA